MKKSKLKVLISGILICSMAVLALPGSSAAKSFRLRISSGVSAKHSYVAGHMIPFADRIEKATKGQVRFMRFYAGELCKVGKALECLRGGSIDVSDPFITPYHAGGFPLTDVTQLPVLNTDTLAVSRAFQKLFDSKVPLKDGKTFYQLEVESKGLVAWPLSPTGAYVISTTGKRFNTVADIKGTPIRAGAKTHLLFVKQLGATEVYMTAMDAYEAFSRGAIQGIVFSVADWKGYGFTELIRYTISGVSLGHFPSYLAMTKEKWDRFPADVKKIWNKTAREMVTVNAKYWNSVAEPTIKESKEKFGAIFEDVKLLPPAVQNAIKTASVNTWKAWIEEEEANGRPGRATARLWADLVVAEGGGIPEGVKQYLNKF